MLVTEENGVIELLPALPENFAIYGEVRDMVVNGAKISFEWKNGLITNIESDKPVQLLNTKLSDNISINENIDILS